MFQNIGGKIKGLAVTAFILEALGLVIAGIGLAVSARYEDEMMAGILTLLLGPVIAWVSSWLLYGFGELIEKVSILSGTAWEIREAMKKEQAD